MARIHIFAALASATFISAISGSSAQEPTPANTVKMNSTAAIARDGVYAMQPDGNLAATIAAAGSRGKVTLTPGATYSLTTKLKIQAAGLVIDGQNALIQCSVPDDDCIEISNPPGSPYGAKDNQLLNLDLEPMVKSTGSAIHDTGWGTIIKNLKWTGNPPNYFSNGIQVDNDQSFTLEDMSPPNRLIRCDSAYCGSAIYNPAGRTNAAVGWISNSNLSMGCDVLATKFTGIGGNGIDWEGGNELHLNSVILQAYSEFGLRFSTTASGADGLVLTTKTHVEQGNCINPSMGNGTTIPFPNAGAGIIMNGGILRRDGDPSSGGAFPVFAASGGTENYAYYVVANANKSAGGYSAPLPIGYTVSAAQTLTATNPVSVVFPTIPNPNGNKGPITCDLLRVDQNVSGIVAPYPGNAFAVQAGIPCDAAVTGKSYVALTDSTPTERLTPYTAAFTTYAAGFAPTFNFWPGHIVLGSTAGTGTSQAGYVGLCLNTVITVAAQPGYLGPSVPNVVCTGVSHDSFVGRKQPVGWAWTSRMSGSTRDQYTGNTTSASMQPLAPAGFAGRMLKGVLNMGVPYFGGAYPGPTDALTLADSNIGKTIATAGNHPLADAGDTAIGIDAAKNGLSLRDPQHICSYINTLPNYAGAGWEECLTSASKTFKVPVTLPSLTVAGSTGFLYANGADPVRSTTTIPMASVTGARSSAPVCPNGPGGSLTTIGCSAQGANPTNSTSGTVVASIDRTMQSGNIPINSAYIVPPGKGGSYLFTCYTVVTSAAILSSTLPYCAVRYPDADTGVSVQSNVTSNPATNTVGTVGYSSATVGLWNVHIADSQSIEWETYGYASRGDKQMRYAVHVKVQYLGP